jgi:hypothetical protein
MSASRWRFKTYSIEEGVRSPRRGRRFPEFQKDISLVLAACKGVKGGRERSTYRFNRLKMAKARGVSSQGLQDAAGLRMAWSGDDLYLVMRYQYDRA